MAFDNAARNRDPEHETRAIGAVQRALASVPFYTKQNLAALFQDGGSLESKLTRLPLLTRERIRPTLPKVWFPEGRDAKAELASGSVSVIETGSAESRVRVLFDARWWRAQERRALGIQVEHSLPAWSGRMTPHVLRHYCASSLYTAGMDIKALQELLGHLWLATTSGYVHVRAEHIERTWNASNQRLEDRFGIVEGRQG